LEAPRGHFRERPPNRYCGPKSYTLDPRPKDGRKGIVVLNPKPYTLNRKAVEKVLWRLFMSKVERMAAARVLRHSIDWQIRKRT
jgi:hypothetical protein